MTLHGPLTRLVLPMNSRPEPTVFADSVIDTTPSSTAEGRSEALALAGRRRLMVVLNVVTWAIMNGVALFV